MKIINKYEIIKFGRYRRFDALYRLQFSSIKRMFDWLFNEIALHSKRKTNQQTVQMVKPILKMNGKYEVFDKIFFFCRN